MNIIFLLICVSLTVALLFLGAFLWAVRSGQYEDDYTPSVRMLFDQELTKRNTTIKPTTNTKADTAHVN